jgi:hypothetical protein
VVELDIAVISIVNNFMQADTLLKEQQPMIAAEYSKSSEGLVTILPHLTS